MMFIKYNDAILYIEIAKKLMTISKIGKIISMKLKFSHSD